MWRVFCHLLQQVIKAANGISIPEVYRESAVSEIYVGTRFIASLRPSREVFLRLDSGH